MVSIRTVSSIPSEYVNARGEAFLHLTHLIVGHSVSRLLDTYTQLYDRAFPNKRRCAKDLRFSTPLNLFALYSSEWLMHIPP